MSDSLQTPWTVDHQAPLSTGFSRQKHWSELLFPSPTDSWESPYTLLIRKTSLMACYMYIAHLLELLKKKKHRLPLLDCFQYLLSR